MRFSCSNCLRLCFRKMFFLLGKESVSPLQLVFLLIVAIQNIRVAAGFNFTFGHGKISSPLYPRCFSNNHTILRWRFSPLKSSIVLLRFTAFHLRPCAEVQLAVILHEEKWIYCGDELPPFITSKRRVNLEFHRHSGSCGNGFVFEYLFPRIGIHPKIFPVSTNSTVQFNIPELFSHLQGNCSIQFNNRKEQVILSDNIKKEFTFAFSKSGLHDMLAICTIHKTTEGEIGKFEFADKIVVQDFLNSSELKSGIWWPNTYYVRESLNTPTTIHVKHRFVFPVTYHLVIGSQQSVIISQKVNYFSETSHNRRKMLMKFTITAAQKKLLGFGLHEMLLLLENDISSVFLRSKLSISSDLAALTVKSPKYVDLYPSTFPVTVALLGSPASIKVNVIDSKNKNLEYNTHCDNDRECKQVIVPVFVKSSGVHRINVTAKNSLGVVSSSWGPIESFPIPREVFVISPSFVHAGKEVMVLVFYDIKTDGIVIRIQLNINGVVSTSDQFSVHLSAQDAKETVNSLILPFNPENFMIYSTKRIFPLSGPYEIKAAVITENNKAPTMSTWSLQALPQNETTCLAGVRIKDGNKKNFLTVFLKTQSTILLSADAEFTCKIKRSESIHYQWNIIQVKSLSNSLKSRSEIQINAVELSGPELVIRKRMIPPGLYVVKLTCTVLNSGAAITGGASDFTSIEIETQKLHAQICGGRKREIGNDLIKFAVDATCSFNPADIAVQYTWFCALSEASLPSNKYVGTYKSQGSCFHEQPSLIGAGDIVDFSRGDTIIDGVFFIRLFASAEGFNESFADQEIKVLTRSAPVVNIICWLNCEKKLNLQEDLVLQLECHFCVSFKWNSIFGEVSTCKSQQFCKIPALILLRIENLMGYPPGLNIEVQGTGVDNHGRNATAMFLASTQMLPNVSSCNVTQNAGIAFIAKFNISCPAGKGLVYKFYLENQDKTFPLLQYGYEYLLQGFTAGNEFIRIQVESCISFAGCSTATYAIHANSYLSATNNRSVENELNFVYEAIKSENLQKVASVIAMLPSDIVNNKMKEDLTCFAANADFASTEAAKQISDILMKSTRNLDTSALNISDLVLEKVIGLNYWIQADTESSSEFLKSIARSLLFVLSNLLESQSPSQKNATKSLIYPTADVINKLGETVLQGAMPGIDQIHFGSRSFNSYFRKFITSAGATMRAKDLELRLKSRRSATKPTSVKNLRVVRFNSSTTIFDTGYARSRVVIGVSFSRYYRTHGRIRSQPFIPTHPIKFYLQRNQLKVYNSAKVRLTIPYNRTASQNVPVWIRENEQSKFLSIRLITSYVLEDVHLKLTIKRRRKDGDDRNVIERSKLIQEKDFYQGVHNWRISKPLGEDAYELNIDGEIKGKKFGKRKFVALDFTVVAYATTCGMWIKERNAWEQNGCKVIPGAAHEWNWCECDFQYAANCSKKFNSSIFLSSDLTVFENGNPVLPRSVWDLIELPSLRALNTSKTVNGTTKKPEYRGINTIVVVSVTGIYVFSGLLLLWAAREDVRRENSLSYVEVCDNSPAETYRYVIIAFTGGRIASEPTSTIAVKVRGRSGLSMVHILQKHGDDGRHLSRGNVASFFLTAPTCLGDVSSLEIWHDGRGNSPNWYIDRITVRDLERDDCWFFIGRKWISRSTVLYPATMNGLHSFRSMFLLKFISYLMDHHLWFSIYSSRYWNCYRIHRAEKVACCTTLILSIVSTLLWIYHFGNEFTMVSHVFQGFIFGAFCSVPSFCLSSLIWYVKRRDEGRKSRKPSRFQGHRSFRNAHYGEEAEFSSTRPQRTPVRFRDRPPRERRGRSRERKPKPSGNIPQDEEWRTDASSDQIRRSRESSQEGRTEEAYFPWPAGRPRKASSPIAAPAIVELDPASMTVGLLPWIFRPVFWLVMVYILGYSTFAAIIFGNHCDDKRTLQCLVAVAVALAANIFLYEPLLAFAASYFTVMENPRLDVSLWVPPLYQQVVPSRTNNPAAVAKRIDNERKRNPMYKMAKSRR